MKTLVFANQKGGVGKSALATQFALYLRRLGLSVVVVDLDHQQNSSRPLKRCDDIKIAGFTASQWFEGPEHIGLPDGPFVLVGGDERLSSLERQATRHNHFVSRFRNALAALDGFDICIIDTNPNPDIRYASALIAATHLIAPIQLNQEAIDGIAALFGHERYGVHRVQSILNPNLKFVGIVPNMVEPTPFQRSNFLALSKAFGGLLLRQRTPDTVTFGFVAKRTAIAEAQAAGWFVGDMTKTSAREAWRELKPVFDVIIAAVGLFETSEAAS